ncbi:hypothetical protein B4589_001950 [Halolamina sp. CBA1230]|uniref:hypothetical protein n=1 Tax=Halolamina sp. CBA1230 TaxID=1853690 RepID=UPI0009A22361|nr:hypothetical protein [Halolamina sp. CBA1230]QKY19198.1 hypothetical protein B4589_001950 [Halolamina sp. CBA1230]
MNVDRAVRTVWRRPIGRLAVLLVGCGLLAGVLTLRPGLVPVVRWSLPVGFVLWGASRLLDGVGDPLTAAAGCLLLLGGFTYASYLLVPMGELGATVAQFVPIVGVFVELFAAHYRDGG